MFDPTPVTCLINLFILLAISPENGTVPVMRLTLLKGVLHQELKQTIFFLILFRFRKGI